MQFSANGPDIPDALIQAHEEGRVVFFCGAGVSMFAGLPDYKNLVKQIYVETNIDCEKKEKKFFVRGEYHNVLTSLENRLQGGRERIIQAIHTILNRYDYSKSAFDMHKAILKLSISRENSLRLVTTNYDSLFDIAAKKIRPKILNLNPCIAPMLTVPKETVWNNLVFLHGKLPETIGTPLPEIIASSGDFGRAYLTERWASRFVSELFRNYIVCFIGYSVNDPIMRYMMDAIAADGKRELPTYAFASCNKNNKNKKIKEWEDKKIIPILYQESKSRNKHNRLKTALVDWASYSKKSTRERIIDECINLDPSKNSDNDNFAERVVWAILDPTCVAVKKLSSYDSDAYSLKWLFYFCENEKTRKFFFQNNITDKETRLQRLWIIRWLMNHKDNHELFLWIINNSNHLDGDFISLFKQTLETELAKRSVGKNDDLKAMRTPWNLFLTDRIALSNVIDYELHKWNNLFRNTGYDAIMRIRLKEILAPKVKVDNNSIFHMMGNMQEDEFTYDIVVEHNSYDIFELTSKSTEFIENLPLFFNDFQQLVIDLLELSQQLGKGFYSSIYLPSIEDHRQNSFHYPWTILVVLLRNAWVEIAKTDKQRATNIARYWSEIPYPLFERLALFAASFNEIIPSKEWAVWLLRDNAKLLWKSETMRETMRLLVKQGQYLSLVDSEKIVQTIISAPSGYGLNQYSPHAKWVRLKKLYVSGADISENGNQYLYNLSEQFPDFKLYKNQKEEFSSWTEMGWGSSRGVRGVDNGRLPKKWKDIVEWLNSEENQEEAFHSNKWRIHAQKYFMNVGFALAAIIQSNKTTPDWAFQAAFNAWSSDKRIAQKTWNYFNQFVASQRIDPNIANPVSHWLSKVSDSIINPATEKNFIKICESIFSNEYADWELQGNLFSQAINHPIGISAEAFFKCSVISQKIKNDAGLPDSVKQLLTHLFDIHVQRYKYARCILSPYLLTLFQIDPAWTKEHILPLYNWKRDPSIANYMWIGFLHSPRVNFDLFDEIKYDLIETKNYYHKLETVSDTYVQFITNLILSQITKSTFRDLREIITSLPPQALVVVSDHLLQTMWNQKDNEKLYINHIKPFLRQIWRQEAIQDQSAQEQIAENFARISIEAKNKFPDCLSIIKNWLIEVQRPVAIISLLSKSDLCAKYPESALELLSVTIGDNSLLLGGERLLGECLNQMTTRKKAIQNLPSYQKLLTLTKYGD